MEQLIAELGLWSVLLVPLAIIIIIGVIAAAVFVVGAIVWIILKLVFFTAVCVFIYTIWATLVGAPQIWTMF